MRGGPLLAAPLKSILSHFATAFSSCFTLCCAPGPGCLSAKSDKALTDGARRCSNIANTLRIFMFFRRWHA